VLSGPPSGRKDEAAVAVFKNLMTIQSDRSASLRERLVAWNCAPRLPRALICRLAAAMTGGSAAAATLPEPRPDAATRAELAAIDRDAAAIAAREVTRATELGADLVTLVDPEYPETLRMLSFPPPAIYVHGRLPDAVAPAVAIVGARRASEYGREVAAWLGRELASAGVVVVSGFAVGVDAAAHRGALAADGGLTVAALGCGLDVDYPRGHRELGERISASGARISEFPPGRPPNRWQFPVRNRLIAALASACVVVEAAPRSGSLVTARLALELGREVLAVPGRVTDELALGTNALIVDGARPALDPRDILEAIGLAGRRRAGAPPAPPAGLDAVALALWRAAAAEPAAIERLAERCDLAADEALARVLELDGCGAEKRDARVRALPERESLLPRVAE